MCGRYSLYDFKMSPEEFEARFGFPLSEVPDFPPAYNIGPYREVPVILHDPEKNRPGMRLVQWQLIPPFAKEAKSKYAMFNTRDDSFDKKPFWRGLLRRSRCIFPANNFFEWEKRNGEKIPYKIELADGSLMGIGGIYSVWHDPEGQKIYSASMITVPANALVQRIHNRMPLILPRRAERDWLHPEWADFAHLRKLIQPLPPEQMRMTRVSRKVNQIRNDGPEIIAPIT